MLISLLGGIVNVSGSVTYNRIYQLMAPNAQEFPRLVFWEMDNIGGTYADDGPSEVITVLAETTLELEVKYLTLEAKADLQGHTIVGGILIKKSTDIPPYVIIPTIASTVPANNAVGVAGPVVI